MALVSSPVSPMAPGLFLLFSGPLWTFPPDFPKSCFWEWFSLLRPLSAGETSKFDRFPRYLFQTPENFSLFPLLSMGEFHFIFLSPLKGQIDASVLNLLDFPTRLSHGWCLESLILCVWPPAVWRPVGFISLTFETALLQHPLWLRIWHLQTTLLPPEAPAACLPCSRIKALQQIAQIKMTDTSEKHLASILTVC